MAMDAATIERLIKESLPDAQVSIEDLRGDGDHYAAHVVSSAFLFGEDQARYLIETASPDALLADAKNAGIYAQWIGTVGGLALTLPGGNAISVSELKAANEAWLPAYMAGP